MSLMLGVYKHYKGKYYEVLGIARHTETEEELVVYRSLYGTFDLWVRPLTMFVETIIYGNNEVPRFTFVSKEVDNIV